MTYNLCHSCKYYHEEMRTPSYRIPKHCSNPFVRTFSLENGGFITGIDIFYCEYHLMYHPHCGDVVIRTKKGGLISYVNKKERKEKKQFYLSDNSQNIKQIFDYGDEKQRKPIRLEEDFEGFYRSPYGLAWSPF